MGTVYGSSRELTAECRGWVPVQRQHRGRTRSVACGSRIQLKMSVPFCYVPVACVCACVQANDRGVRWGSRALQGQGKAGLGGPGFRAVASAVSAKHVGILRIGPSAACSSHLHQSQTGTCFSLT
jgi:hypothetical protein